MNNPTKKFIIVGKINAPWGLKGFVKFNPSINNIKIFKSDNLFYIDEKKIILESTILQNNKTFLKFQFINNANDAQELQNKFIKINTDDYADEDIMNPEDKIIGMKVKSSQRIFGNVKEILKTGANDVYIVETADGEILIPVIDDFIKNIDLINKEITIHNDEGL